MSFYEKFREFRIFGKFRENKFSRISRKYEFSKISRKQIFAKFAIFCQIREIREKISVAKISTREN